jgi:hypothetical protein
MRPSRWRACRNVDRRRVSLDSRANRSLIRRLTGRNSAGCGRTTLSAPVACADTRQGSPRRDNAHVCLWLRSFAFGFKVGRRVWIVKARSEGGGPGQPRQSTFGGWPSGEGAAGVSRLASVALGAVRNRDTHGGRHNPLCRPGCVFDLARRLSAGGQPKEVVGSTHGAVARTSFHPHRSASLPLVRRANAGA